VTLPDLPVRPAAHPSYESWAALVASLFAAGTGLAWSYLSMRSVMAVGTCADGGPYVSAQHCPPGSGYAGIAIPVLVLATILGTFVAASLSAPNLLVPVWLVVAGGLAGKFLVNALTAPNLDPGYLVLAFVFGLVAAPAVVVIVRWWRRSARHDTSSGLELSGPLTWVLVYTLVGAAGGLVGTVTFLAWT
jgi:hypothetical protein